MRVDFSCMVVAILSTNCDIYSVMLSQLETMGRIPIGILWIFFRKYSFEVLCQPLGQRSNCCRSRKSIRGHYSMFNLFPVYNPFLLQVLPQLYFTSTTPNKDQQKEQLFCSPIVLVL